MNNEKLLESLNKIRHHAWDISTELGKVIEELKKEAKG